MIDQGCKEVEMAISLYQEVRRYTTPPPTLSCCQLWFHFGWKYYYNEKKQAKLMLAFCFGLSKQMYNSILYKTIGVIIGVYVNWEVRLVV